MDSGVQEGCGKSTGNDALTGLKPCCLGNMFVRCVRKRLRQWHDAIGSSLGYQR